MPHLEGTHGAVHYQAWTAAEPRAVVVLLPGFGEHSGLYERFARRANPAGVSIYAVDHAGHGLSDGARGIVTDVDHLVHDAEQLVSIAERDGLPLTILGHGVGAVVGSLLVARGAARYASLVISGGEVTPVAMVHAALGVDDETLARSRPEPAMLSSDVQYLELRAGDPLIYDAGLPRATAQALIAAWPRVDDVLDHLQLPVLVVHGDLDAVVTAAVNRAWAATLPDARFCLRPDAKHDVLNDHDHDLVADVVLRFVLAPEAVTQAELDDPTPIHATVGNAVPRRTWEEGDDRPPDLVLIMTDEQRFDWVGYASDGHFATPNLDRLAGEGVCFERAYSAFTTCVPARTSLLTGLHQRRTLTQKGAQALREGFWTVARELQAAGYETAMIGRMHFTPIHADHGFETTRMCENINPGSGYDEGDGDDYRVWLKTQDRPDWRVIHRSTDGALQNFRSEVPRTFPDTVEYHSTSWVEREAISFLETRDRSRPLFLIVSFPHPHAPYDPPEPYASMYSPDDTVMPADGFDVNDVLTGGFRRDLELPWVHAVHGDEGTDLLRRVLTAIRGLVRHIDDSVGRIVDVLDLPSSVVFFTSDHGDYGGHRGLFTKVPWIPFDDLIRVPLVVAGGPVCGGRRSNAPAQSASFAATCLDYAGIPVPDDAFDFPSLRPLLDGDDDAIEPDRALMMDSFSYPMIRRGPLKLITNYGTADVLLFDLDRDPGETISFATDPAYADATNQLLADLAVELKRPPLFTRLRGTFAEGTATSSTV